MEKGKVSTATRVVIIAGSAGSLEVLMQVLPRLQSIPTFSLVIVLHRKNTEDTTLEELIALKTIIPVKEVEDKTVLAPGYIYVAPSDYHLLFETNGELSLDISEKINYSRPSIDVSFESAAEVFGNSLTAILLSGANADGTKGLQAISKTGGTIVIQDPDTADMPFMPRTALENTKPDKVLDVSGILQFINSLGSL